ncbi:MAG: 1-deoxy-D-xylulose-5-phosphate reductoisomerase [Chromatiales bacterium]|jgi:1-deoxy-D-xylulose-5-phosphate reductoisomerase|nr:1-deoxy-D-xylulose-5-phosphate reductoisomerase [Chromatiales bacterium]
MKGVTVLGSTGTIGMNTLDVVSRNPEQFQVFALSAHRNVDKMVAQCGEWQPAIAVMADRNAAEELRSRLRNVSPDTEVLSGTEGLIACVEDERVDQVMAGIVGAAGLLPTLAAARAGKRVLLANKEALVMSGELFMQAVRTSGAELLPIDSEHNAIFQCMPPMMGGERRAGVRRVLLTGSGGPFRTREPSSLWTVTPDEACAHPNWVMGRKISVDSATMMNKGLEFIEASWLFSASPDEIQVVIHPQSIVHSMVEFDDGSVLAQMGNPDMRTPIAHAMAWPERALSGVEPLDFFSLSKLEFEAPDYDRFPCLKLALHAARMGGEASAVANAANEVAVQAFLDERLSFPHIAAVIESGLERAGPVAPPDLETVLAVDALARAHAEEQVSRLNGPQRGDYRG